jgi:predicted nucleic acid-binding Zn finger protein
MRKFNVDKKRFETAKGIEVVRTGQCSWIASSKEKKYLIHYSEGNYYCECPDSVYRNNICKHIISVLMTAKPGKINFTFS